MKFTSCGCFLGLTSPSNHIKPTTRGRHAICSPCDGHGEETDDLWATRTFHNGRHEFPQEALAMQQPREPMPRSWDLMNFKGYGMGKMGKRVVGWCCGINVN